MPIPSTIPDGAAPRFVLVATHAEGDSGVFDVHELRGEDPRTAQPSQKESLREGQEPAEESPAGVVLILDEALRPLTGPLSFSYEDIGDLVTWAEARALRWVWESTRYWYGMFLTDGMTVERCWDLGLCRTILSSSPATAGGGYAADARDAPAGDLDAAAPAGPEPGAQGSLFAAPAPRGASAQTVGREFAAQRAAVPRTTAGRKLELLLAAESAGALIAAEIRATGMPWSTRVHRALLEDQLGPRPPEGHRPQKLERVVEELRAALGAPKLNPDSPQELLRALHRAGIDAASTSQWELADHEHPALEVLERYKKLSRLFTSNGWAWLAMWVRDGKFWPDYTVGGVVTGRWSARGGGALQIPATVRSAVRADPGCKLVVADASQLEPRILAAMSRDEALAIASTGKDLYQAIANRGFGGDRASAKIVMLGAMYGQTSGDAGRLMPQLAKTYPQAVGLIEHAAREGEAGRNVSTFLGRGSPGPDDAFAAARRAANSLDATPADQSRADSIARSRGRFTRNFVVQGTAAEWALCWLGQVRLGIRRQLPDLSSRIVFFLHDEVMLHVPADQADEVVRIVHAAAARATELVFRSDLVETPVTVAVVDSYDQAK
ncbi:bifunctional 3'-5' exonuclease/DNA polymerase [Zhihengliuella salsuginis]|uniref:DNA-directed DNA polymerase n=1 Tax=Zhihengliuella salsuginis TaxID=578222 RepID=A0ABQ3GFF5_9MICC|nr:bifunctional 3'-5' exonuclease/DNA polymerase [Zhihengliuella salsuginis]GHD02904.1 bifunctional 3'-5' exonuclease/DNA polymerase [Zhihengliuella salsuginis]